MRGIPPAVAIKSGITCSVQAIYIVVLRDGRCNLDSYHGFREVTVWPNRLSMQMGIQNVGKADAKANK